MRLLYIEINHTGRKMRAGLFNKVSLFGSKLKIGALALFALAAGLVAVFDLGDLFHQELGQLPASQSPDITVFHNGDKIEAGEHGLRVDLHQTSAVRLQIASNSEVPTLIEGISIVPADTDKWQVLEKKKEKPAHGSISVSQYVLKPTENREFELFSVKDGQVSRLEGQRLMPSDQVRTISADVEDLLLIDFKPANLLYKSFCADLIVEFRFETGTPSDVSARICFVQS